MPAKQAGDSKQGLIIALVCFVLLSIILGVTTYMGYDGQTAKDTAAKEAATKAKAADDNARWWKYRALQMQALATGLPLKEEAAELQTLSGSPPSGSGQTEFVNVLNGVSKTLTNDKGKVDTYEDRVKNLTNQLNTTREQLAAAELNLKRTTERYVAQVETKDAEVNQMRTLMQQAQATVVKDREAANKSLEEKLAQFDDVSKNLEITKRKLDEDSNTRDKFERKQKDDIRLLQEKADKLKNKLEQENPTDWVKFDRPKGKIEALSSGGQIANEDIGLTPANAAAALASTGIAYVVLDRRRAGSELVRYVESGIMLRHMNEEDGRAFYEVPARERD